MAKRIQFSATGGPEVLQYVDFTPLDPAAGEVQIENKAIGINYIDTYVRSGLYAPASLPSGLGTEAAGVVVKVGAGGVGLIACQWAKALGARLIGSVGSDEKAALAKQAGAWATINYHKEDIAQRVAELTHGEKVGVVYDSVGQSTWQASLNSLKRRGLMVSFGNASGPVTGVDLALLNQKGSLYVTRPSLNGYITNRAELQYASNELFSLIGSGAIRVEVKDEQKFALADAQRAHQVLESRGTSGSSLLIP